MKVSVESNSRLLKEGRVFLYQGQKGGIEMLNSKMCSIVGSKFHMEE